MIVKKSIACATQRAAQEPLLKLSKFSSFGNQVFVVLLYLNRIGYSLHCSILLGPLAQKK